MIYAVLARMFNKLLQISDTSLWPLVAAQEVAQGRSLRVAVDVDPVIVPQRGH
jgi:hypothetical protein